MIERFLSYLRYERNRSELTVKRYERTLNDFQAYFRAIDSQLSWQTVDADIIRGWMESLMDKGNKATSVCADLSALRTFFRFALSHHLVDSDPARALSGPKKQKPLPQFLQEREVNELLDDEPWSDNIYNDVRARTILLLLYEAGLRRSELTMLNDEHVDFVNKQLKVTGKRNKQRIIPFGMELEEALKNYMQVRDEQVDRQSEALFVDEKGRRMSGDQVYYMVKKHLSRVTTLEKRSPHVMRHTFATALLNHEASLESVRRLLGHESLDTTEIYTHTTFEQLKRVYKEAHPRG